MRKHYANIILTSIGCAIIIVLHLRIDSSLLWLVPVILIHIGIVLYGVLNLSFNYFFFSHKKGGSNEKLIALTFDDGPSLETNSILQILKEHNVPASFFCIGKQIEKHPDILIAMDKAGHLIGNHSFNHNNSFNFLSTEKVYQELTATNAIIEKTIQKKPIFFRPPNGVSNPMLAKALKKTNLISIAWNVRTFDTFFKNPHSIFSKIKPQLKANSIILMHDTMPHTKSLVLNLIRYCKEHNYKLVRVDKLLNLKAYE